MVFPGFSYGFTPSTNLWRYGFRSDFASLDSLRRLKRGDEALKNASTDSDLFVFRVWHQSLEEWEAELVGAGSERKAW